MADLEYYGSTDPIYFVITLSGDAVTGLTLASADLKKSIDGGVFSDVGNNVTEVGEGWYKYTPSNASEMQGEVILFTLNDQVGTEFDENRWQIHTGNDPSAKFTG